MTLGYYDDYPLKYHGHMVSARGSTSVPDYLITVYVSLHFMDVLKIKPIPGHKLYFRTVIEELDRFPEQRLIGGSC